MENAKVAEKKRNHKTIEMEGGRILRQCRTTKLARSKNTEIIVARNSYPGSPCIQEQDDQETLNDLLK